MEDKITSMEQYQQLVMSIGKVAADQMASASGFFAGGNMGGNYGGITTPSTKASVALQEGGNLLTGNNDAMSMAGMFGDNASTGWLAPGLNLLGGVADTVLGYMQFQETKKMNAEKLALLEESNNMKKLQMRNKVNQANRYAMLGMGNSNSQGATMRAVNSTPYTSYQGRK